MGWVAQQYLPDVLIDRQYYEPSDHGYESEVKERMRDRR
jgi:putative ATPase